MKVDNIIVAGDVGVGTTTLARNLATKLNWKFLSAGEFFRQYSLKHDIPLWNKAAIPDDFEKEVDNNLLEKLRAERGWVIEGHYIGWFARNLDNVYRILLTCDRQVANERMLKRSHTHVENVEEINKRREGLYTKFKKLYSQDNYEDPKFYHLVLDTTKTTPEETVEAALAKLPH
jgi:cytidylate kinase